MRYRVGVRASTILFLVASIACGDDDVGNIDASLSDASIDAATDAPTGPDYYDPDTILEVEIELDPADWETLRAQERDFLDILGGEDCRAEPFESPFTWFEADVTVAGVRVERVGVRKKGFLGSLSREKPSLKIDFDEIVADQLLFDTERLTLNNAQQDPGYLDQCLGFALFTRAGVPASRCNFAHVTVNGEDMGLYVNVEPVKKRFLRRWYDDDEGNLYEGTLSDFRPSWTSTFEQKTNRETPSDFADVQALSDALELPDDQVLAAVEGLIDVDAFIRFWATEVLIGHVDGYAANTNNFFVYGDPVSERLHFIPWGNDQAFLDGNPLRPGPATPVFANGMLANRLYDLADTRERYRAEMIRLLDEVWDADELLAEVDRMEALIGPYLQPRDMERGHEETMRRTRFFIEDREVRMRDAIAVSPDESPPPRTLDCLVPTGTIEGTFDTEWGTLAITEPFAMGIGTDSTLEIIVDGEPQELNMLAATAGFEIPDDEPPRDVVLFWGVRPSGTLSLVFLRMDPGQLVTGADEPLGFGSTSGAIIDFEPGQPPVLAAFLLGGALRVDESTQVDGSRVFGTVSAELYPNFF